MNAPPICRLQRSATVRLRREAWGGIAFDRAGGDLLDLDAEAFSVLRALQSAHALPALQRRLGGCASALQRQELLALLRSLEQHGFIRRVAADALPLPQDRWSEDDGGAGPGLRAPLVAHWAVTYHCNLHCSFCYSASGPHRPLGPAAQTRQRLVERLAEWGVLEVALGGGEPTVLPDFPELLAAIRAVGMVPNVTTNGTIGSASVLQALAEHAGVVHLSADRPELLDSARGHGVFARLKQTAARLVAAGVRLGVNLLLTPQNVGDIGRSLDALVDLGAQSVTFLRPKGAWAAADGPGSLAAEDLNRLGEQLREFVRKKPALRLYVDTALRGEWVRLGLLQDPEPEVLGCGGGQRHVAVTPEGDVYPCSHQRRPEYLLGNLLSSELSQLWARGAGWTGRQHYLRDCQGVQCPCLTGKLLAPSPEWGHAGNGCNILSEGDMEN